MGSGSFLVQVCRWLGDRVVEAWHQEEAAGAVIDVDGKHHDKGTADSVSSLAVYQTQLDGINSHVLAGESNLFMVGKYRDKFILNNGKPKFIERITQLDTRRLDKGSHWPI